MAVVCNNSDDCVVEVDVARLVLKSHVVPDCGSWKPDTNSNDDDDDTCADSDINTTVAASSSAADA